MRRLDGRRAVVLVVALLVGVLCLTGCRDSRSLSLSSDGKPKIVLMVGGLNKVIYLPAMLTRQLGGFASHGIDVQLLDQASGANAETALISGQVQGVVGFYDHTVDLQAKQQCITSVVQMSNIPGEVIMVGARQADQIRSAADFRGRKMGITSLGSSTDFLTKALAAKAHVGTADFTPVKVGAGQTFIASLNNGGIDAGMTTDPTVAQLVQTGQGKVLYDLRTERGTRDALGGLYPATSLYMSCSIVERYPDVAGKLAAALVGTLRWMHQHTPEQIADAMPAGYAGGNRALYVQSIRDSVGMFNADGRMDADGARNVLTVLSGFSKNVQRHRSNIDLSRTYTTRFVDAVPAG